MGCSPFAAVKAGEGVREGTREGVEEVVVGAGESAGDGAAAGGATALWVSREMSRVHDLCASAEAAVPATSWQTRYGPFHFS